MSKRLGGKYVKTFRWDQRLQIQNLVVERKIRMHLDLLSIPQFRGEKMSTRLGGIKGCKYKTSSPMEITLGRGEAHRYTVHLH